MLGALFREWRKGLGAASQALGFTSGPWPGREKPRVERMPLSLTDSLRQALDAQEFELHYQPIVDLLSRQWLGAEALIRWRRGDGKLVLPKEFIPEAERSGLITDLGAWVIEQATRDQLDLRAQGLNKEFFFTVNVAVPQLVEWEALERALEDSQAKGASLRLEVTESTFDPDVEGLARRIEFLRKSGAGIAIDDFGTGFSSLSRLHELPVTTIKIDQGFIARAKDHTGFEILQGIAAIARGLGFDTVVEGIEQESQVKLLLSMGLTVGQGYLFARPAAVR